MPATDLKTIIDAFQSVLEAAPLSLKPTQVPFTHDRQPNTMVADSYYIDDGGTVNRQSVTNDVEVRVDRLRIWVAKPLAFAGQAQFEAMEQLADTIYRYLLVNARANGWNVDADARRVTRPAAAEVIIGEFGFRVDYDFNSSL